MANSDIQLLFGVLGEGKLSGESGKLIKEQLGEIVKALNGDPFKILIDVDIEESSKNWSEQISKKLGQLDSKGKFEIKNVKISKIDTKEAVKSFQSELEGMLKKLKVSTGFDVKITESGAASALKEVKTGSDKALLSLNETKAALKEIHTINNRINSDYKKVQGDLGGMAATAQNAEDIQKLRNAYLELETAANGLSDKTPASEEELQRIYRLQEALQGLIATIRERVQAEKASERAKKGAKTEDEIAQDQLQEQAELLEKIIKLRAEIAVMLRKNSAAEFGKSSGTYRELEKAANYFAAFSSKGDINSRNFKEVLDEYNRYFKLFKQAPSIFKANDEAARSLGSRVGTLAEKFATWFSVSQAIMQIFRALKQMVSVVVEIDTAMTELRKVTNETELTYAQFLDNTARRAKMLGTTISDTVTATADFARLGYNITEATDLADAAIVYKNVGDGIESISAASESIISTMQAFGIETEKAMLIVDKFNEVGNNFAISSTGIGEALKRSAAAMNAANNTLDETIALITAANTVVQNPESVGKNLPNNAVMR